MWRRVVANVVAKVDSVFSLQIQLPGNVLRLWSVKKKLTARAEAELGRIDTADDDVRGRDRVGRGSDLTRRRLYGTGGGTPGHLWMQRSDQLDRKSVV